MLSKTQMPAGVRQLDVGRTLCWEDGEWTIGPDLAGDELGTVGGQMDEDYERWSERFSLFGE